MVTQTTNRETDLDLLSINTIRMLSVDAVQAANSGHPGMPMGAAAMAYALWTRHLHFNPRNPRWPDRDRFVLSAGHGSMLLYALLYLTGYDLSIDDIRNFRQWGSRTPGHPEHGETPGVETTTGPLGQGFGNAVGMALAEARLSAEFNRGGNTPVDHRTYVIASDGDLMEGVHAEASSLAGHLGLGKLIVLYDDNAITIDGDTSLAFSEDVGRRFRAYGWQVQWVEDGNDLSALDEAIHQAGQDESQPSLIGVRTHIGFGSPNKQDSAAAHGAPLGEDEIDLIRERLEWPGAEPFHIPEGVMEHFRTAVERGAQLEADWESRVHSYALENPELAAEWRRRVDGKLIDGWDRGLPEFGPEDKPIATRAASGYVLNALAESLPELMGGSADLSGSNNTVIDGQPDFSRRDRVCSNLRFGVREHAMGSLLNGMALHSTLIPYGGTFLIFSDYMRPAIRLAALMRLRVVYVFTHDSIALGEDGPTHQPIEHLASLRALPGLTVIRPADANEVRVAWRLALENIDGPTALILTRQKLPILDRRVLAPAEGLERGGYVLMDAPGGAPEIILVATGSEVALALEAARRLVEDGIIARVVNLGSFELFERQPQDYRDAVMPPHVKLRLAVEAGSPQGWHRHVGDGGDILGINRFGASAPGPVNLEKFGFNVENVEARARALLDTSTS